MRARIIAWVSVVFVAPAAAGPDTRANYRQAVQLAGDDDNDKALALVEAGLASAPKDLQLLELKGTLLLKMRDYPGALAAYQAYIDAGAAGANKRAAQKIVASLQSVRSSFLEIAVANGPAFVYLDSRTQGTLCTASPSCKVNMLPGDYKVIAERPGFDRWTKQITVTAKQTTRVEATLVEKPSRVVVRVANPGARISIDGAPLGEAPLPAGDHELVVALAGYGSARRHLSLHEGKTAEIEVALAKLVAVDTVHDATFTVDGTRVVVEDGGIPIPDGVHEVVVHAEGFHDATVKVPADRPADYKISATLAPLGALVHVDGVPAGAQLVVDGASLASAPFHGPVEVAPGAHRIEIRAPGFLPYRDRGSFASAQAVQLRMTNMRPVSHRDTLIAGTVTLGVLALGAGASWFALRQQTAYEQRAALPGVTTTDPTLLDMRASGQHLALAADIAYGLAAVGAGVSTYLLIREGRRESQGSLQLGVGPAGASVAGRF